MKHKRQKICVTLKLGLLANIREYKLAGMWSRWKLARDYWAKDKCMHCWSAATMIMFELFSLPGRWIWNFKKSDKSTFLKLGRAAPLSHFPSSRYWPTLTHVATQIMRWCQDFLKVDQDLQKLAKKQPQPLSKQNGLIRSASPYKLALEMTVGVCWLRNMVKWKQVAECRLWNG